MENAHKRSLWLGIAQQVLSVVIGVAIAAFFLGGARQKVQQKVGTLEEKQIAWEAEWKAEKAHITAMDLEGSVATRNFIENYNKKQAEQDATMKDLQKQANHLESIIWRLDRIERKVDDGRSERDRPP